MSAIAWYLLKSREIEIFLKYLKRILISDKFPFQPHLSVLYSAV